MFGLNVCLALCSVVDRALTFIHDAKEDRIVVQFTNIAHVCRIIYILFVVVKSST